MRTIAILQSNYIPWKGYLDLIRRVDEFVIGDDVQYTKNDWRNRNLIKTQTGLQWLTIPVRSSGATFQKIHETKVVDATWTLRHLKALRVNYKRTPFFDRYSRLLETLYSECEREEYLSAINRRFLTFLCGQLDIRTRISWSLDYPTVGGRTERLIGICLAAGATRYISGPAAKDYIVPELFNEAGIKLEYMDYSGYPEYPQLYGPFEHKVSVLDLLFMTGPDAPKYLERSPR